MKMLRTIRKSKNMTMKELGNAVGVSEGAISQYETGKRQADYETLFKICGVLDCTPNDLFGVCGNEKAPTPVAEDERDPLEDTFKGLISRLSDDQKQLLLVQLQAWTGRNE